MVGVGELIDHAESFGFQVSKAQIARWRRHGLMPEGTRKFPGRGSRSVYPETAMSYVVEIAALLKHNRNLDWVGWKLWTFGFDMPERFWRFPLSEAANEFDRIRGIVPEALDSDDFSDLAHQFFAVGDAPSFAKRIRKAVGAKDFETVLMWLLSMLTGDFSLYASELTDARGDTLASFQLLDRAMGLGRARTDKLEGSDPWLQDDYSSTLRRVSDRLANTNCSNLIGDPKSEQLNVGREEYFYLRNFVLYRAATLADLVNDSNAFGFGLIARILADTTIETERMMLLLWLIIRQESEIQKGAHDFIRANLGASRKADVLARTPHKKLRQTKDVFPLRPLQNYK